MNKNELKPKNVKGRIKVLRAMSYKNSMVYIRQIGIDIFMYDLIYNNEIYSSYMIFTPRKGQTKLTSSEVQRAGSLIWSGAVATIEALLDKNKKEPKDSVAARVAELSN